MCEGYTYDFLLESPGDYDVLSTATQIPACEDHVCVDLQAISDGRVEMDEMLEVLLQSAPGLDSSISTGGRITVTIKNNDSKLSCSQSSYPSLSHTHTYTHMLSHTHIHTLSHMHSLSLSLSHTHTYTHSITHALSLTLQLPQSVLIQKKLKSVNQRDQWIYVL